VEGHGLFKDVPHGLLGITQEQVAMEREYRFGESLAEANLELHVAVELIGFLIYWTTNGEINVLICAKKRMIVKVIDNAVNIECLLLLANVRDLGRQCAYRASKKPKKYSSIHIHLL
jgi:hypothetical protein